jgi:hypothetical protein
MSSPQNQEIPLNPLIPFVKRNPKSWRSETIQLGKIELEIKKTKSGVESRLRLMANFRCPKGHGF